MQQSNRKLLAAPGHNSYSPASSIDAPLEEDSKEGLSDNFNANNSNNNHSSAPTIFTTREGDNQITPHVPSTTPQTHHDPIITFLYQLRSTWTEPAHQRGAAEDVDEDLPEDKPLKLPNRDIFLRGQDKQTSHTSFVIIVAKQATTVTLPRAFMARLER
jgi:hypothetical protein